MTISLELQQEISKAVTAALQKIIAEEKEPEEKEPVDLAADELEKNVEASIKRLRNFAAIALAAGVYKKM